MECRQLKINKQKMCIAIPTFECWISNSIPWITLVKPTNIHEVDEKVKERFASSGYIYAYVVFVTIVDYVILAVEFSVKGTKF